MQISNETELPEVGAEIFFVKNGRTGLTVSFSRVCSIKTTKNHAGTTLYRAYNKHNICHKIEECFRTEHEALRYVADRLKEIVPC